MPRSPFATHAPKDLPDHRRRQADILVGAVGKPEFIKAEWVKEARLWSMPATTQAAVGDIELSALTEKRRGLYAGSRRRGPHDDQHPDLPKR